LAQQISTFQKVSLNISSLFILIFTFLLGISNPFWYYLLAKSFSEVILFFISGIVIIFNFIVLFSFRMNNKREKYYFILFSYLICIVFVLGPSIVSNGLFNNDSFYHLYIVKKILINQDFPRTFVYTGYFLHYLIVEVAKLLSSSPHDIFLFFPQFLSFTLFFIGIYLFIFTMELKGLNSVENSRKMIFLLTLFLPRHIFQNAAFHPFYFVVSLMPLIFYLTLHLNLNKFLLLSSLIFIACNTHIFGLAVIFFIFILVLLKVLLDSHFLVKYSSVLVLVWLWYVVSIIILFLMPLLIEFLSSVLPLNSEFESVLISGFMSRGAVFSTITAAIVPFHYIFLKFYSLKTVFDWLLFYMPFFLVIIYNQLYYYNNYKKGVIVEKNKFFVLQQACDYYFVIFFVNLLYGTDLHFERLLILIYFLYFIMSCIFILICIRKFIETMKCARYRMGKRVLRLQIGRFFKSSYLNAIFLIVLVCFCLLPFVHYRYDTIKARYEVCSWINEELPDNSTFLASKLLLSNVINGLTLREANYYCNNLFNTSIEERIRISHFLNNSLFLNKSVYIVLDILETDVDTVWIGNPSVGSAKNHLSLINAVHIMNSSEFFLLRYEKNSILVYELKNVY